MKAHKGRSARALGKTKPNPEAINIVIVHGNTGHPETNWYPWMTRELIECFGKRVGLNIVAAQYPTQLPEGVLPLPTSETPPEMLTFKNQTRPNWTVVADKVLERMDPRCTIIIGHSYGGLFVHDLADDHGEKIKQAENAGDVVAPYAAIFAISPVGLKGEITGLNPDCVPGLPGFRDIDADNVRRGTEKITVIVGSDDKIVNPQDSRDLAKYCKADECITVQGYGHFREGEGCVTFPLLFKLVEKTIEDLLTSIVSQV